MLAVATTGALYISDPQSLRRTTTIAPACTLDSPPTCHAWAPDNSSLFLARSHSISQYDASGALTKTVYDDPTGEAGAITALVAKDRGNTVIFSAGERVHVLDSHAGRLSRTLGAHRSPAAAPVSLALSNDATLLAAASAAAVHVHNLAHGAQTALRGIPAGESVATCEFHPHARTRLLVGAGAQVLVYDTTRPSGPLKTIAVGTKRDASGEVVAIASSPFSKTLVAVACSGGTIALVDLEKEKEKSIYKTWSVHVPITCLAFSPEGATLYVGTENGKVLGQDLRALDKPPKSITVSENGDRVVALSMQQKLKPEEAAPTGRESAASKKPAPGKPLIQQDQNKVSMPRTAASKTAKPEKKAVTSPVASRTLAGRGSPAVKSRVATTGSPRTTRPRAGAGIAGPKSPATRKISAGGVSKKAFSPPKSPPNQRGQVDEEHGDLSVSIRIETLLNLPVSTRAKENSNPIGNPLEPAASDFPPSISTAAPRAASRTSAEPRARMEAPPRVVSGSSNASASTGTSRTRSASGSTTSSGRASKTSTRPTSVASSHAPPSIPPVPKAPSAYQAKGSSRQSLTPSPDLSDVDEDAPATPLPKMGKRAGKSKAGGMGVLGLGTPELDRWIKAGEVGVAGCEQGRAEGKNVGFVSGSGDEDDVEAARRVPLPGDAATEPPFAIQVSPARRPRLASASGTSWAAVPSPLRNLSHSASQPHLGSPNTRAAAGLLQTLLRDAMYEFRQETHGELVGLHLDMLRMGRGLRGEMRAVVEEFRGEISELREENRALRAENERLKRGF